MGMLDGLVPGNDPRLKRELEARARGDVRQASHEARNATLADARAASASTQARARDAGMSGGLAERLAGRQYNEAATAAGQQFAQDRRIERNQAESQLADLKAQRGAFMRQLLGKGLQAGGALASQMGVGSGAAETGGGGPQGVSSAGGFLSGQGGGGGLGALGGVAGMAVGGPVGGAVGGQLGGMLGGGSVGGTPQTMGMVDQAMAGFPGGPGEQPAPMSPWQQQAQAAVQGSPLAGAGGGLGGQLPEAFWRSLMGGF